MSISTRFTGIPSKKNYRPNYFQSTGKPNFTFEELTNVETNPPKFEYQYPNYENATNDNQNIDNDTEEFENDNYYQHTFDFEAPENFSTENLIKN
ncbi:unnamed protein product [Ceutorhynchus assimilis]|uniref:Uncharacterized protein n=1 Tax=Ceutorhynchus assimilis TaxID=467358 RepID=A0A9N9MPC0_9CUCU|nr:unnamed protein product [Ceutorhynchus assimilis]